MATDKKNQTDTAAQVDTEATEAQSAKAELADLESTFKVRRKELRATLRDEGKAAIVEAGTNLANDLYEALIDIATQAGQKINRFTIRLGDDGKAVIKSAVVRLPKNDAAVTTVEPDPAKQAAVKKAAAAKKSGK